MDVMRLVARLVAASECGECMREAFVQSAASHAPLRQGFAVVETAMGGDDRTHLEALLAQVAAAEARAP